MKRLRTPTLARCYAHSASLLAAILIAALPALTCAADVRAPQEVRTMRADAFLDSIAVNIHITYTDGAYADARKVADDLAWIGVHHVREGTPTNTIPFSTYLALAQRGIKFNLVVHGELDDALGQLDRLAAAAPGSIAAVEGYNEIDNFRMSYRGRTGEAAALDAQRALYAHVHGSKALAGVPVYDLTGFDVKRVATRAGSADFANQHAYPQNGDQPASNGSGPAWIAWAVDAARKYGLPVVMTEFGYFTIPQAGWNNLGVDDATQAKGVLNGLFSAARLGVTRTYLYELLDEKPDPQNANSEMHFGVFRNDHTPKPAANTIRNLTAILRAASAGASTNDSPSYVLRGMPESGRSLLLAGGNGHYLLALWNEVPFWDRATGKPLNAGSVKVQVEFEHAMRSAALYDPTVSADSQQRFDAPQRLTLDVPDHVILLDVISSPKPGG
ncbi:glycoside hydrolase 5 family protein [Paraburkholderia bannensis]|uniref:calcium-binding protein n=1 Tax=Paraburkholderia bannensis TaxID=765414 RepID=UPI002ABD47DA|nr:calcium-binding protein [Paraburkholderia bannensis]